MSTTTYDTVTTGDWLLCRLGISERLVARPEQRDRLVQRLLDAAELLACATGCYIYLISISAEEPDAVWVTEAWRSKNHRDAALDHPHARTMQAEIQTMLVSADQPVHSIPVGGKGLLARHPVR